MGGLPAVLAGCAFDSEIAVQFRPTSPAVVTESFSPEQVPHRVHGATSRRGQVVGIDCSITIVYDVNEATGPAVLVSATSLTCAPTGYGAEPRMTSTARVR
jgi:hypothetical protein